MPEQLKNRLLNYEVPPPPGAWKNIAAELVESNELLSLSEKMYDFEAVAPVNAWNTIADSLINGRETGQASIKNMPRRMNKVMAAAAVFGILLMGSLYVMYNNSSKKQVSDIPKNLQKDNKKAKPAELPSPPANQDMAVLEEKPAAAITNIIAPEYVARKEKKNSLVETNKILRNTIVKIAHVFIREPQIAIAAKPIRNEKGDIIQDLKLVNTRDEYISITGPSGEQTKISSKFKNLLLYLNGDSDIEEFDGYFDKNFLESLIWKSRFENWRKKIIETSFSPSSTNFMDILEFKDLLLKDKENQ